MRPSTGFGAALPGSPSSSALEKFGPAGGQLGVGQHVPGRLRLAAAQNTGAAMRLTLGLARHSGDWNSSPTALQHLRKAFLERCGIPELEVRIETLDLSDVKKMLRCRMILATSNNPIAFQPAETEALRQYVLGGGTLWINDSSSSESDVFDAAFRADAARILPAGKLAALPMEHPFFTACYDLSRGYKGFRVPPGDKYRVNYIEAIDAPAGPDLPARAGLIYTRNDYADGLEIDPRMDAGMKSLTDLTNAEMQEASLRFGMNLLAYCLGPQGMKLPSPPQSTAEFEKIYRYGGPPLPAFDDFTQRVDQWQKPIWQAEKEWCNPAGMSFITEDGTGMIELNFTGGPKDKAALTRNLAANLSAAQALVFDLHSSLGRGFNVSLLFAAKDGKSYETRPVFVRPGWNRNLRFPLNLGDMKSSASRPPWKDYNTPLEPRNSIERVTVLIYNLSDSGTVKLGPIRAQK